MSSDSRMGLRGVAKFTNVGFALPCYSLDENSNSWHTATCSINGDHNGTIVGFDLFHNESEEITHLPNKECVDVLIGSAWIDIFTFDDEFYIGTPESIWLQIADHRNRLLRIAPLSLLDLATFVSGLSLKKYVTAAEEFILERFGSKQVSDWRVNVFMRQQILIELNRAMRSEDGPASARHLWIKQNKEALYISHPAIGKLSDTSAGIFFENIGQFACYFGFTAWLLPSKESGLADLANVIGEPVEEREKDESQIQTAVIREGLHKLSAAENIWLTIERTLEDMNIHITRPLRSYESRIVIMTLLAYHGTDLSHSQLAKDLFPNSSRRSSSDKIRRITDMLVEAGLVEKNIIKRRALYRASKLLIRCFSSSIRPTREAARKNVAISKLGDDEEIDYLDLPTFIRRQPD